MLKAVNDDPRTTQNLDSALVICYNTKESAVNFHDDSEQIMDSNSSIATVSFGSTRTMEFCVKGKKLVPEYSLEVANHDMVIMNPGCQEHLLHRICPDKTSGSSCSSEWRFAISFRRVTPFPDDSVADSEISYDDINNGDKKKVKHPRKL